MHPETAKKLMEDVPEMKDFVSYLATVALQLKDLSDIGEMSIENVALVVRSRQEAYKTIIKILDPLINVQTRKVENTPKRSDFGMD